MVARTLRNGLIGVAAMCYCMLTLQLSIARPSNEVNQPLYRRPVDLLVDDSNMHLLVACSATGELEVYNTQTNEKLNSLKIDDSIDAIVRLDDNFIAVCSTKGNRTHILAWAGKSLELIASVGVSYAPVQMHWDSAEKRLFVACLWSRRIDTIQLKNKLDNWTNPLAGTRVVEMLQSDTVWDVPIAPRMMVSLGNRGLVVADGFGREMLVLDPNSGATLVKHDFFGTSIRGLSILGNDLVALHSMLNEFARTDQNEIHWGVLLANDVRLVNVDLLLTEHGDRIYVGGRVNPLGIPGNGAAEPTDMAVHAGSNRIAVTVGGTDQVALGRPQGYTYQYISVGRFPSAVAWSKDGKWLYVANQFDDMISVIDVEGQRVTSEIFQGPMRKLTDAELGEQLFHSATLSHDRWLTCASCHVDGHTNGQLTDNLGDRNYGAPKRVPSLLGIKGTGPFTWLGHEHKLTGQVVSSIRKTMHSYRKLDEDEVEQLAAYMESLPPVVSLSKARNIEFDSHASRGQQLFEANGCADCHIAPTYTSQDVYDIGVIDEKKQKLFNPPSLRGVSQRGPELFHDNRVDGLRSLLVDHKHRLKEPLPEQDVTDLIAFLNSL